MLLIDSHILLWAAVGDPRLRGAARVAFEDPDNLLLVSAVTLWEIGLKVSLGKLPLRPSMLQSPMLLLLLACSSRPDGIPSINGDPAHSWPELPALDQEIVQIMERDRIAGLSACMVIGGETRWCGGYGDRDPELGTPALPSTPFLLASVSKTVVAVADMMTVEQVILDLDAPINNSLDFQVTTRTTPKAPSACVV